MIVIFHRSFWLGTKRMGNFMQEARWIALGVAIDLENLGFAPAMTVSGKFDRPIVQFFLGKNLFAPFVYPCGSLCEAIRQL